MSEQQKTNHDATKEITSPWTQRKYKIRQLSPWVLSTFGPTLTIEQRNVSMKIRDKKKDIKTEQDRQKNLGQKDESLIQAMEAELKQFEREFASLKPDSKEPMAELNARLKLFEFGMAEPKIKTLDDFFNLGIDSDYLYHAINAFAQATENYEEDIEALFRRGQPNDKASGAGS